ATGVLWMWNQALNLIRQATSVLGVRSSQMSIRPIASRVSLCSQPLNEQNPACLATCRVGEGPVSRDREMRAVTEVTVSQFAGKMLVGSFAPCWSSPGSVGCVSGWPAGCGWTGVGDISSDVPSGATGAFMIVGAVPSTTPAGCG